MDGNLSDDRILISPECGFSRVQLSLGGGGGAARAVQFSDRLSVSQKPKLGLIFNVVKGQRIVGMKTLLSASHDAFYALKSSRRK